MNFIDIQMWIMSKMLCYIVCRYSRSEVIGGPVYAGKDRHNAEVAAFHLSILLGLRRSPLTVGRKVNLRREVMPVATNDLLETFYQEGAVNYSEVTERSAMDIAYLHLPRAVTLALPAYFSIRAYNHTIVVVVTM
jgi:hypothetical protein